MFHMYMKIFSPVFGQPYLGWLWYFEAVDVSSYAQLYHDFLIIYSNRYLANSNFYNFICLYRGKTCLCDSLLTVKCIIIPETNDVTEITFKRGFRFLLVFVQNWSQLF